MNILNQKILPILDILLLPLVYPAAWLLKKLRGRGIHNFPYCKNALLKTGVFPIQNHYFEPQFDYRDANKNFSLDRNLQAIDWNISGQIGMLEKFEYSEEIINIPKEKPDSLEFYLNNGSFEAGDAEYWYQIIRVIKPNRIFEIGSGNSTLMAIRATHKNKEENSSYECQHVCIEPYEQPWLEELGISVIRQKAEDIELSFFSQLRENDILFIDSSHIIRPQGDVLFEYLELLPSLNKGVIVHIHDIFSPKNYLAQWLQEQVLFWNEQYLLEAFLSHNHSWKIIGALNFLHHNYYEKLKLVAPFLQSGSEPGSFYIQKIA